MDSRRHRALIAVGAGAVGFLANLIPVPVFALPGNAGALYFGMLMPLMVAMAWG